MSNKIKIGEWINNKEHPLQELDEARYCQNNPYGGEDYEEILVLFKFGADEQITISLAGQYFLEADMVFDWSDRFLLVISSRGWDIYEIKPDKPENELLGEVELIAYMLIPEYEVRRE